MKVSGPYSITLMEQNNRKFCLIADVHIEASGCQDTDAISVSEFLRTVFSGSVNDYLYLLEYSVGLTPVDNQGFMVELFSQSHSCFVNNKENTEPQKLPEKEQICKANVKYVATDIRQCKDGSLFTCWASCKGYDNFINNLENVEDEQIFDNFMKINCEPEIVISSQRLLKDQLLSFKSKENDKFIKAWKSMIRYLNVMLEKGRITKEFKQRVLGVMAVDMYAISMIETEFNNVNNVVIYSGRDHIDNYLNYIQRLGGTIMEKTLSSREDRCLSLATEVKEFFAS